MNDDRRGIEDTDEKPSEGGVFLNVNTDIAITLHGCIICVCIRFVLYQTSFCVHLPFCTACFVQPFKVFRITQSNF